MDLTKRAFTKALPALTALLFAKAYLPTVAQAAVGALPKTFSGQTIRIQMGTGPVFDAIRKMSVAFTAATGVKVEFTGLSYTESYQKLILDLTSGAASFDAFTFAYQWKHEMGPFMADLSNVDKEVQGAPPLALDDYPGDILDVYGKVGGKLIGLPILGDVTLMVWNKDDYKAAGLDPSVGPESWDKVVENGKRLAGKGKYGFGLPAGKSPQTAVIWMLLLHAFGGRFFGEKMAPEFNSAQGRKAMRFIVEQLQPLAPPGNLTWDFPEMLTGLETGASTQSMMWPGGFAGLLDPKQSQTADKVAWEPTPGVALLGGWSVGVNAASRSLDAAKLFAAWLASPEVTRDYALIGGAPARRSALTDPQVVAKSPQAPSVLAGLSGKVLQFPPVKEAEQVVIMIQDEVNAAAAGVKTPDQASDDLQAKVVAFVANQPK